MNQLKTAFLLVALTVLLVLMGRLLFGDGDPKKSVQGNVIFVTLKPGDGTDTIFGDDGNDVIIGGGGGDEIHGGTGNDTIIADAGKLTLDQSIADDKGNITFVNLATVQVLTVSSSLKNPLTVAGRVLDVVLELWAVFVITAVAGSFASFFHSGDASG